MFWNCLSLLCYHQSLCRILAQFLTAHHQASDHLVRLRLQPRPRWLGPVLPLNATTCPPSILRPLPHSHLPLTQTQTTGLLTPAPRRWCYMRNLLFFRFFTVTFICFDFSVFLLSISLGLVLGNFRSCLKFGIQFLWIPIYLVWLPESVAFLNFDWKIKWIKWGLCVIGGLCKFGSVEGFRVPFFGGWFSSCFSHHLLGFLNWVTSFGY